MNCLRCVWMSSTWRGPHRAHPQDGIGRPCAGLWVQVDMKSDQLEYMLHTPTWTRHREEADTVGQQKWSVPFSNSLVLGALGWFWTTRWGSHPILIETTWCHSMNSKSFRGQGCSVILAKQNDRFGDSLLYPFEKGRIFFSTLDRKLADLA